MFQFHIFVKHRSRNVSLLVMFIFRLTAIAAIFFSKVDGIGNNCSKEKILCFIKSISSTFPFNLKFVLKTFLHIFARNILN